MGNIIAISAYTIAMEKYWKMWATMFHYPKTLDQILELIKDEVYVPLKEYPSAFFEYQFRSPNVMLSAYDIVWYLGPHDLKEHIEKLLEELLTYPDEFSATDFDSLKETLEDDLRVSERYNGKAVGYATIEKQIKDEDGYWLKYYSVTNYDNPRAYDKDVIDVDEDSFIELTSGEAYYFLSLFQDEGYPVVSPVYYFDDGETIVKYRVEKPLSNLSVSKEYPSCVQAFVINNSFDTSPEELLLGMQTMGEVLLDGLLLSNKTAWTVPRWSKTGDIVFFMFKKTANATISATRTQYRNTQSKYSPRERRLIEIGLNRGNELYRKYGGCIFGFGRISGENYYERNDDGAKSHWNSPIYAPIEDLYFFDVPIHIDDFRDFLTISRANSITPVLGDAFDRLRNKILERNNVPDYFKDVSAIPIPLRDIDQNNWIKYGIEYRRNFFLEDAFRKYYVDYLLRELGDRKKYFRECGCYKDSGNPPRVDNVIYFNGKLLPVEVKISIGNERDLPGQARQYCHVERIVLDSVVENTGDILYDDNVLIVDRDNLYMYDYITNRITKIYNLDELTDKSKITDLRRIVQNELR